MSYKFDDKGFVFRSGPSKVQKNQYSSFWINNNNDDEYDELFGTDKPKGRDLVQLASYKRAISNFVNIVTGESIPVVFNSKDESYTNGKKVVIGSNLTDKNFDVAVGLALHEGSHIKLSDFDFLRHLETNIPQEIYNLGETMGVPRMDIVKTIKSILNYVEDRRIDYFIFSSSPGYKGYYNSMYDKYFYSKNVDKGLLSKEYRTEEIESYMFRIINIHNKNRQLGSLKGLKEIWNIINLPNINRLKSSLDLVVLEELDLHLRYERFWWISILVIPLVMVVSALGYMSITEGAVYGVIIVLLLRSISIQEAYQSINWTVIFLLAALVPFNIAIKATKADIYVGEMIINSGQSFLALNVGIADLMPYFLET